MMKRALHAEGCLMFSADSLIMAVVCEPIAIGFIGMESST